MAQKLFIVESPTKAKKITQSQYLDKSWLVVASYGHIRDLPQRGMGVAAPDFKPTYETGERSGKTVGYIRKLAKDAESVWLATDDDREGEAIAWHLQQVIGQHTYHRVTFREVTKSAIQAAIQSPSKVNYPYFLAQQARRVIDRLAGYTVSPALRDKTGAALSAGRVQTPPLRMVVERENAIAEFKPTDHFGAVAITRYNSQSPWALEWDTTSFVTEENPYVTDPAIAQTIIDSVKTAVVTDYKAGPARKNPPPPLVTSTLQQAGNNKLNLGVEQTMKAAQLLFENGLITYHRTDDPNLSDEAVLMVHAYLRSQGLEDAIAEKKNTWKSKDGSQDAHEAIRPVDFNATKVTTGNDNADAIYQLIWRSAVCCQMKPAIYDRRIVRLTSLDAQNTLGQSVEFTATGRTLRFKGWLVMMDVDPTEEASTNSDQAPEAKVPECTMDDVVNFDEVQLLNKKTKPPARFTEASLVKSLEKEGIGRPSTYASILSILKNRRYVEIKQKKLHPTDTGRLIYTLIKDHFAFAEIPFTRELEESLDALAHGQRDYVQVVTEFNDQLTQDVERFNNTIEKQTAPTSTDTVTHECPECGNYLHRRKGSNGYFWGCQGYPDCRYTAQDNRGKPQPVYKCPVCHEGNLIRHKGTSKAGRKYDFFGCSNFKGGCKATYEVSRGKPKAK